MSNDLLQEAIDVLTIRDVYLKNLIAETADDFDPKYWDYSGVVFQRKQAVAGISLGEVKELGKLFRVELVYGARWTEKGEGDESEKVLATIEAKFIAEYLVEKEVERAAFEEFAFRNANYHVWPYWRELLMSQVTRMHLPRVVLPTHQIVERKK